MKSLTARGSVPWHVGWESHAYQPSILRHIILKKKKVPPPFLQRHQWHYHSCEEQYVRIDQRRQGSLTKARGQKKKCVQLNFQFERINRLARFLTAYRSETCYSKPPHKRTASAISPRDDYNWLLGHLCPVTSSDTSTFIEQCSKKGLWWFNMSFPGGSARAERERRAS